MYWFGNLCIIMTIGCMYCLTETGFESYSSLGGIAYVLVWKSMHYYDYRMYVLLD